MGADCSKNRFSQIRWAMNNSIAQFTFFVVFISLKVPLRGGFIAEAISWEMRLPHRKNMLLAESARTTHFFKRRDLLVVFEQIAELVNAFKQTGFAEGVDLEGDLRAIRE